MTTLPPDFLLRLSIPRSPEPLGLTILPGMILFVVGTNGTGKSALLQHFNSQRPGATLRVSAHRQTWLSSNASDLSPRVKLATERSIGSFDRNINSRWQDNHSATRPQLSLYKVVEAETDRAIRIARAVDTQRLSSNGKKDVTDAIAVAEALAPPLERLNHILRISQVPITLKLDDKNKEIQAVKRGAVYDFRKLSDGERSVALLASDILTAPPGTLLLLDEPERHLHRSISRPMLGALLSARQDCYFVVSTHDLGLVEDFPDSTVISLWNCSYGDGDSVQEWDAAVLEPDTPLDPSLKRDILGARPTTLFVEGTGKSLDKRLYSLVFPNVTVIAKGSRDDVERSVKALQSVGDSLWLTPIGLVDRDNSESDEVNDLEQYGIFSLDFYSVESIYYHPEVQRRLADRRVLALGGDAEADVRKANIAAIEAISEHRDHLIHKATRSAVKRRFRAMEPSGDAIDADSTITVTVNPAHERRNLSERLDEHLASEHLVGLLKDFAVRESPALTRIARALGFSNRSQYEDAVLNMLAKDPEALAFVRGLFGPAEATINTRKPSS